MKNIFKIFIAVALTALSSQAAVYRVQNLVLITNGIAPATAANAGGYTNTLPQIGYTNGVTATNQLNFASVDKAVGVGIGISYNQGTNVQIGASNVVVGFNYSYDGTNFTTTIPLWITNTSNGTNTVNNFYSWTNPVGVLKIRPDAFENFQTNATTNLSITVAVGYPN